MQVLYEGVDITDSVCVASATYADHAGGRMDELDIAFEQTENWLRWQPRAGDRIEVREGGVSTGEMYVHAVCPEDKFLLRAYGARSAGRDARWKSFENLTLQAVAEETAGESGMKCALFGIDGSIKYHYLLRRHETPLAFLQRLATMEGAVLKCVGGKMNLIGIDYAQALNPVRKMNLSVAEQGLFYTNLEGKKIEQLGVNGPERIAWAWDNGASTGRRMVLNEHCADMIQAKRWACGALKCGNRQCERIEITTEIDGALTAMMPVEIVSADLANGRWLVQEAAHDLVNRQTKAVFVRQIDSVT